MTPAPSPSKRKRAILSRAGRKLLNYFEMPPDDPHSLPQEILLQIGLRSWPIASVAISLAEYLIFLLVGAVDGTLATISQNDQWWFTFIYPVLTSYLLLVQPWLRRLLHEAIETFRPMLPAPERFEPLINEAYALKQRNEWLAIIVAVGLWLLFRPWSGASLALALHNTLGGALTLGLTGWHLYSGLTRTRVLAKLYDQAQAASRLSQGPPVSPIIRWSLGDIAVLLSAILLSAVFIGLGHVETETLIIYGIIILAALLILSFSKMPTIFLSQMTLFRALTLFFIAAIVGTIGFNQLEHWSFLEAFYATIITMTTVGYGDFSPQSEGGKIFTIALSLFAIVIVGYAASAMATLIVEGNFRRFLQNKNVYKQISQLDNHIILCGAGRIGQQVALEFYKTRTPFVLIEWDSEVIETLLCEIDIPYIQGDATEDQMLRLAQIQRARGLVTTLNDDKDNAFVMLSARETARQMGNFNLRIISRINDKKQRRKLTRAGADVTISPHVAGGQRMAMMMLHPHLVTFLDEMLAAEQKTGQILRLEEVHVNDIKNSSLATLREQNQLRVVDIGRQTGLLVVIIKRHTPDPAAVPYIYTPRGNTALQRDDILIVLGDPTERAKLYTEEVSGLVDAWLARLEAVLD